MTARTTPPFRADQVGSLLRPPALAEARAKGKAGELPPDAVRAAEDEAIREVVALQEGIGMQAITDGEFRRDYWHLDFLSAFEGCEIWEARRSQSFSNTEQPPMVKVTGKVSRGAPIFVDHFAFLKSVTTQTPKITLPGPAMIHLRPGNEAVDPAAYRDMDSFWADLTAAYRKEIADLAAAGCTYLQIDDVSFAYLCDEGMRQMFRDRGDDPDETLKLYVSLINEVLKDRPAGLHVTVHMCRGNFKSAWVAQGGYEPVAAEVLGKMAVDGFFMEYDSERAGGFEPLRHLADGKVVVLGLVSTKTPDLEAESDLKRRIEEATKYVPLERLCLSPQCGFSSTHHGNAVTVDDEKAKLGLVVNTAAEVWGG
ncbi:5-methyltetrahydropteroyltriglutamate--homocysteine S-methyltransferase [Marinibaculum pumilum]|uniref:5-methyltetrahydropteroyltriglutamate--homocysteine S-methyltransferase n=1 Tax=Marinibaculum pumilum TaxID=1766165 RepID=A0ABV7L2B7_9PROT